MTTLTQNRGPITDKVLFFDATLQIGNIAINQDAYTTGLDRIYEVRGLSNLHVEIENTGANGLIYKIEKATKVVEAITNLVDGDFDEDILGNTTVAVLVAATGTVTLATVLAGDTVTINGLLYTAVAGAKANNEQFSIDGTDTVDAADLTDSITNDTRVGTLKDVTATSAVAVVTLTSTAIGANGNAVTLASSDAGRLALSGATFSGGIDNKDITDIIDISPESTAIRIRIKRETAGQNTTLAGIVNLN